MLSSPQPRLPALAGSVPNLAGFSYHVGATYAGEPVEVVASGGLVDILDATAGLTVTRLANVSALQVDPSS